DRLAGNIVALADKCVGVKATGCTPDQRHTRDECPGSGVKRLSRSLPVGFRCQERGVVTQRDGQSLILRSREALQCSRKTKVDRFKADNLAILRAGVVETAPEFFPHRLGSLDTFERLLEIAFAGAAA